MIDEILVWLLNVALVIMWVVVTAMAVFHWYGMSAEVVVCTYSGQYCLLHNQSTVCVSFTGHTQND
jgi:hypothetical protein